MNKLSLRRTCQDGDELSPLAHQVGQVHRITDGYFDESSGDDADPTGTSVEDYDLDSGSSRRRDGKDFTEDEDFIPRRTGRNRDLTQLIR
jgi:hypothetical protein